MNKIDQIKTSIEELEKQLNEIQCECSHPKSARESKNDANTGNYDPSADSYWTNHHCTLCDKKWTEDQ